MIKPSFETCRRRAFTALQNFRWELKTRRHHLRALRKARAFRGQTGLKLHLGCGDNIKPGFVNCMIIAW
jgi:hypothetical protein